MIGKELIGRESESVLLKVRQEDVRSTSTLITPEKGVGDEKSA